MEKIWAAVSQQGVILKQLLLEHSAPPALPAPLGPHGAASADWPQEDILSFNISEEAGKQELMFSSEDVEPDTTSPAVKLSLSSELMLLLRRATSTLQVPWTTAGETRQSIFEEPTVSPINPPVHLDFFHEIQSSWSHPATSPAVSCTMDTLYRAHDS
ncbi:UNVERIFIED_CONTAM: hypothetical protein FKN15_036583 [Acipenser sinensis]